MGTQFSHDARENTESWLNPNAEAAHLKVIYWEDLRFSHELRGSSPWNQRRN